MKNASASPDGALHVKTSFNRILFRLARSRASRFFIGWIFTHMSFVIPLERLRETETLLAFHHPKPSHIVHILLVPKRPLASLLDISATDGDFLQDLFETVQSLVHEFRLDQGGYSLISNGGDYQDVPHLHFHLVSDSDPTSDLRPQKPQD